MKILSKILLWLFLFISCITLISYFAFPKLASDFGSYLRANAAHLKINKAKVNDYYVHYYIGGKASKKDTIVLLHGWSDSKKGFLKLAKYLSEDYFLIIPDIPGLGGNEKNNNYDYNFKNQANDLAILLDTLKISNYHVAGVSTGGIVSLLLFLERPKEIKSLTLINTPYLELEDQLFFKAFFGSDKNDTELHSVLQKMYYEVPDFSSPVRSLLQKQVRGELQFLNNFVLPNFNHSDLEILKELLPTIKIPILLLHSTNDNLVGANDAAAYNRALINSTYGTIRNTAHYPQYEKPSALAGNITNFIDSHP